MAKFAVDLKLKGTAVALPLSSLRHNDTPTACLPMQSDWPRPTFVVCQTAS